MIAREVWFIFWCRRRLCVALAVCNNDEHTEHAEHTTDDPLCSTSNKLHRRLFTLNAGCRMSVLDSNTELRNCLSLERTSNSSDAHACTQPRRYCAEHRVRRAYLKVLKFYRAQLCRRFLDGNIYFVNIYFLGLVPNCGAISEVWCWPKMNNRAVFEKRMCKQAR